MENSGISIFSLACLTFASWECSYAWSAASFRGALTMGDNAQSGSAPSSATAASHSCSVVRPPPRHPTVLLLVVCNACAPSFAQAPSSSCTPVISSFTMYASISSSEALQLSSKAFVSASRTNAASCTCMPFSTLHRSCIHGRSMVKLSSE